MKKIVLASGSPRRKELLEQMGMFPVICPSFVEEKVTSSDPAKVVEELSSRKCRDVADRTEGEAIVIGADTVVAFEGEILGKPEDADDAARMIRLLQGKVHQVYTGVTMIWKEEGKKKETVFHDCTDVEFFPMTEEEITAYIHFCPSEGTERKPEWADKAGAYGIQTDFGTKYIRGIQGDYYNVMGLPASRVYQELKKYERENNMTKTKYIIRPAREEDLKEVAQVEAVCFPAAEAAGYEDFVERFASCPDSFFVAETEEGRIAGFCNGCCADTDDLVDEMYHDTALHNPEGPYQMIFGLDVHPDFQKQGMGEALMRYMVQSAKERGKKAVVLTCKDHMIPFYEKIGYRYLEVSDSTHGGAKWNKMMFYFE